MVSKNILIKECLEVMQKPHIMAWYTLNLAEKPQYDTIKTLVSGVDAKDLTVYEALIISLVCGAQWGAKFEGVP